MTHEITKCLPALIEHGKFEEARGILQSYCDNSGTTLLHVAAESGIDAIVQHLLHSGIDINLKNKHGRTAIMLAIQKGCYSTVSAMLKFNPDLQLEDKSGRNALTLMLEGAKNPVNIANILEILRSSENNENIKISIKWKLEYCNNWKAIYNAIDFENDELFRLLVKNGYPVNCKIFGTQMTPLHLAFRAKNLKIAEILLEYGADVNVKSFFGKIPLAYYGRFYHDDLELKVVKIVIDRATTLTTLDREGEWQISWLLTTGGKRVIEALFQSNAVDWTVKGKIGNILHYLVRNINLPNDPELFELLWDKNLDVDAVDEHGVSALYRAASNYRPALLRFLLDKDATVRESDKLQLLPIVYNRERIFRYAHYAKINYACIELLLQHVLDPQMEFYVLKCKRCLRRPCGDCFGVNWNGPDSVFRESTPDTVKRTLLDMLWFSNNQAILELILIHLAIIDGRGTLIDSIKTLINSTHSLLRWFNSCKLDLDRFKETKFSKSITLFDLICASEERLVVYLRDQELFDKLKCIDANAMSKSIYTKIFWNRLKKSFRIFEARKNAVSIVCEVTGLSYEGHYVIVNKIIDYFWSNQALRFFSKV